MSEVKIAEKLFEKGAIHTSQAQVSCDLDGEAVILNLQDGMYYGLNPVGARIWSLIQEPKTLDELQALLLQEYRVEPEVCRSQVTALLEELAARGLIEVEDAAAG